MKMAGKFWWVTLVLPLCLLGCARSNPEKAGGDGAPLHEAAGQEDEAEIQAALAKLSPEDRPVAEAQKYCAVQTEHRLGSMGTPVKVMVNEQPVFLCCASCKKKALSKPEETLASVKRLKEKAATQPAN